MLLVTVIKSTTPLEILLQQSSFGQTQITPEEKETTTRKQANNRQVSVPLCCKLCSIFILLIVSPYLKEVSLLGICDVIQ